MLLGVVTETQTVTIPLFERLFDNQTTPYRWATVTLSDERLQVYVASQR